MNHIGVGCLQCDGELTEMTEETIKTNPLYLSFFDNDINGISDYEYNNITGEDLCGSDGGAYLYCGDISYTCDK